MNADEVRQLAELARRLDSTPRRVLSAAMRMTDQASSAEASLANLRALAQTAPQMRDQNTNLLLTPVAGYARNEVAEAFTTLWRDSSVERKER